MIAAAAPLVPLWVFVVVTAVIVADAAFAIDGNYASPYASQYDSRSAVVTIPNHTWLGMLLLLINGVAATFYSLRHRRRKRLAAD